MPQYKVHIAYYNADGQLILPGIYSEKELDLNVARGKSIVTAVDANVTVTTTSTEHNEIPTVTMKLGFSNEDELGSYTVKPTEKIVKVERIQINYVDADQLEKIRGVGKATAAKIIANRPFLSYDDLDKRVPIKNKEWQDIALLDFKVDNEINLYSNVIITN